VRPVVVTYQADWPDRAAVLAASLRERLASLAERVEHIGSTSIPGMAAKDILDVQVSVADLDDAARAFDEPLAGLGFELGPYEFDHVPAHFDHVPAGRTTTRGCGRSGSGPAAAGWARSTCTCAGAARRTSGWRCCSGTGSARTRTR